MKKTIQLITSLICFGLCPVAVPAALYWDSNGTAAGAGATPTGTWGSDAFWNATADGTTATPGAWVSGEDAIFSAGSDATGTFTVTVSGSQTVGNLTVEEGAVTISGDNVLVIGGAAGGKGIINVLSNAALTINSMVTGGDINLMLSLVGTNTANNTISGTIVNTTPYIRLEKREAGTWVLTGTNTYSGVTDIRAGTLVVNSLANTGTPSSVGTGGAAFPPIIGLGNNSGNVTNATLKYIGSGHTCGREIRMYGTTGAGGGVIDASGTGPLILAGNITRPVNPESFDKTLTLTGNNPDANTVSSSIPNGNSGHITFVIKDGPGKWVLSGANAYTGTTTVKGGTLLVNSPGSLAAGGVVSPGATLGGTGYILGPVTVAAGGTLSPGASIGELALYGDLTLSGNLSIEVDRSLSPSNDVVLVAGTLTNAGTGTVTVTTLGPPLAVGDTFYLFKDLSNNNQPLPNGQALTVFGGGVLWTNKLAVDGSIVVLSVSPPPVPATNLTIVAVSPTSFSLGGLGAANSAYNVYVATNVTTPMTNWWLVGTTNSNGGGVIQFLDPLATNAQRFYRFGQ